MGFYKMTSFFPWGFKRFCFWSGECFSNASTRCSFYILKLSFLDHSLWEVKFNLKIKNHCSNRNYFFLKFSYICFMRKKLWINWMDLSWLKKIFALMNMKNLDSFRSGKKIYNLRCRLLCLGHAFSYSGKKMHFWKIIEFLTIRDSWKIFLFFFFYFNLRKAVALCPF